jgi:hypothetical protein
LCNRAPERVGVHVMDEAAPAVDLDDRDPLAVRGLERGIAVDRNLPQLEAQLVSRRGDDAAGRLAEMATRGAVENDLRYG